MEHLNDAFQRITPWYQDPTQEIPETFPKGLSLEDLRTLLHTLPFRLPEEVCELYQWCNGRVNPQAVGRMRQHTDVYQYNIDYMAKASVIPLQESIDLWFGENNEDEITPTWYQFPVLSHENGLIVVAGSDEMEDSSPIWDVDWLEEKLGNPVFPDLASMMTGIADIIEIETQFWNELGDFNERAYWDACKTIWKKYRV